uniref:Uncharacterized protein n=1 Tax=Parastrongyloides trichosuri TaxID=131310 RepID=A0A0N5A6Q8_PARTI
MLLISYAPQNHYCFNVDSKNPELLKEIKNLASCFPNVYVAEKQYEMNSNGKNGVNSFMECIKILKGKKWSYLILAQNDDIPMRTNKELVDIFTMAKGNIFMKFFASNEHWQRYDEDPNIWTYKNINIFNEGDKRNDNEEIMNKHIKLDIGFFASAFPRKTIDYITNNINITTLIELTNKDYYGVDEIVFSTLLINKELDVPGGIDPSCIKKVKDVKSSHPRHIKVDKSKENRCPTKSRYHDICDNGLETLNQISMSKSLFLYRIRPEFDYGALYCWANFMYQKMHLNKNNKINNSYTKNYNLLQFGNPSRGKHDHICNN